MIQPVILCGGSGTRLWPLSTPERPKPFLALLGDRTLFQQSLDRVSDRARFCVPLVVAGEHHRELVEQQADECRLIVEPCARNTAPAIALAAARLAPDTIMLVCPSDHAIADGDAFLSAVSDAAELAAMGKLVCLGVQPDRPETGYGYIERGEVLGAGHAIARFVEKPDAATAAQYLAAGTFAWNAGIFVFRAGDFLRELERHRPDMSERIRSATSGGSEEGAAFRPDPVPFASITGESIDYAVMENTANAAVVSAAMGWSDIGNWDALMRARGAQNGDNLATGTADLLDCRGVMVESDGKRVSAIGLDDVIIVVEGNEVLVVARKAAQDVGTLPGARKP